jgi:hypothetical protein
MKKHLLIKSLFIFIGVFLFASCTKSSVDPSSNNLTKTTAPASLADQISGTFTGTGKNMPSAVIIGSSLNGCITPPELNNYLETGTAQLDISKVSDSTVRITFIGGPFTASESYLENITKSGNSIILRAGLPEEALTYDISTKEISVGVDTPTYFDNTLVFSSACQQGLPYYFGFLIIGTNKIDFESLGYAEFSGTKQ